MCLSGQFSRWSIGVSLGMLILAIAIVTSSKTLSEQAIAAEAKVPEVTTEPVKPLKNFKDKVRVAVAQISIDEKKLAEEETTVDKLVPWMKKAATEKADLLVFPEYLMGNFHLPDKLTDQLCEAAKAHNLNVIVGGWEYLPGEKIIHPPLPGTYANSILVVDRNGKIVGNHRKMHSAVGAHSPYFWPPDPGERGENTMLKGEGNAVVELDFGRVGVLTCYDGYFFESFQMPSLRGAEVLVWVNARKGMVEPHIVQAASFITCTHVVASNQAMGCGSSICSYPGWGLDEAATEEGKEAFVVGDLDLATLREERLNNRMFHQRRPEIYGPITSDLRPWDAYPHLKPFKHGESEESQTAGVER